MPTTLEYETREDHSTSEQGFKDFFASVARAEESALLLDFDGTLAPFRIDPLQVKPWSGVPALLTRIHDTGRTRIGIVTGRPAKQVASQIGLSFLDIWGLHGAEYMSADGHVERDDLLPHEHDALAAARRAIRGAAMASGVRVEEKWNAVVVHWRGQSLRASEMLAANALKLLMPIAEGTAMQILQFDGGIELRAGRNKGDAVKVLLAEMSIDAPVAYLGDDTTDEDAFRALAGRGLTVLVRRERRPSAATHWIRPPAELRAFLRDWVSALRGQ